MWKAFIRWIKRNSSNIYGLLGIALTIYFGVVYVPEWAKDAQKEKVYSAQNHVIQSIKELTYNDSTANISEIKSIIIGKELEQELTIPYSVYEILSLSQSSFVEDKYLSLIERKKVINRIEILKGQVLFEEVDRKKKAEQEKSQVDILVLLSIIFSIIIATIGIISIFRKNILDKEKQDEINNDVEQTISGLKYYHI